MEERKSGACSMLEYLDWYIKQERKQQLLTNHDGSAQVSIFSTIFSISLKNNTAKTFYMAPR